MYTRSLYFQSIHPTAEHIPAAAGAYAGGSAGVVAAAASLAHLGPKGLKLNNPYPCR